MIAQRINAKTTAQGNVVPETVLCDEHFTWQNRETLEDAYAAAVGDWTDAAGDPEAECVMHDEPIARRPDGSAE